MAPSTCQYQPLSGQREIRLLELKPGLELDGISCELIHVGLDGELDFEAFHASGAIKPAGERSFAEAKRSVSRRVSTVPWYGCAAKVNRELYGQMLFVNWWPKIYPVSNLTAAGINQKDKDERSQQVELMADIYRASRSTLIWLSDDTEGLKRFFGCPRSSKSIPTCSPCWHQLFHRDVGKRLRL